MLQVYSKGQRRKQHHTDELLHREMRRINTDEKVAATTDRRGLRRIFHSWRVEAINSPWLFIIVAAVIALLPSPFLMTYFILIFGAGPKSYLMVFFFSIMLCYPLAVLFWLFLVDTSTFSFGQRAEFLADAFIKEFRCDARCALAQVEHGLAVAESRSRSFSYLISVVGMGLFLNVLASQDFQEAAYALNFDGMWSKNKLGTILCAVLPIAVIAYSWFFGFTVYWLRVLHAELRMRFSRLE